MGAVDQTRTNQVIDAIFGTTALVATTTPVRCRLMTANGSATANGTELATGGGYTQGVGAPTFTAAAAATGAASSNSAVTVTNMPACTLNGIEVWDSNAVPKRQMWGAITSAPKTVNAGDTVTIASGSITLTFP